MEHQNNFNYLNISETMDINGGYIRNFGLDICTLPPPIRIDWNKILRRK